MGGGINNKRAGFPALTALPANGRGLIEGATNANRRRKRRGWLFFAIRDRSRNYVEGTTNAMAYAPEKNGWRGNVLFFIINIKRSVYKND